MALKDNLISYWKLEEASGNRVDVHGSNDLGANGAPGQGTGISGNCVDLESSSSQYLSISDASQTGLDISGDFTIGSWVKLESSGSRMGIAGKYRSTGTKRNYTFHIDSSGIGNVLVSADGNTSNFDTCTTDASYLASGDIGNWVFLVCTYDISARSAVFYKNGSAVASSDSTSGTITSIYNNDHEFYVGHYNGGSNFDGLMDETFIASRVWSASEVSEVWNSGSGKFYDDWDAGGGGATFVPKITVL